MKSRNILSAAYDEASSSDSEESQIDVASSDESSFRGGQTGGGYMKPLDSDEEASDDNSSSPSEQESSHSSGAEEPKKRGSSHAVINCPENEGSDLETDADDEDEANLPLQERIQRKEARGVSLQKQRERKRNSLELASERLARYKTSKQEANSYQQLDSSRTLDGPSSKRKKSKHAPTEASSKRSDFYRRGAPRLNESGVGVEIGARRYKPLDPRTSSLSGHLNEEQFEKNYEFLQDMRNKEISLLRKKIAARNETGKKGKRLRHQLNVSVADETQEEDQMRLRQLKQEKADFERRVVVRSAKQAVKKKMRREVEDGKRGAFFLKRKEKKQLEFEAKIEELRKRGGHKAVERALAKRRQKAKSRDAGIFAK